MFLKPLKDKVSLIIVFLFFLLISLTIQASETASEKIEKLHQALIKNNKSEEHLSSRSKDLENDVRKIFDHKKMIKFIYGKKWSTLDEEVTNKLNETFLRYISFNYAKRFNNIENLDFKTIGLENLTNNKILIRTSMITSNDESVSFDYVLNKKDDDWKVFDVLVQGSISEIATKKSDFYQIIKDKGPLGLIEIINKKIRTN